MKKQVRFVLLFIIMSIIGYVIYGIYQELSLKNGQGLTSQEEIKIQKTIKQEEPLIYLNLVPEEYKGYKVSAKLEIEKIGLNTYVLEQYSKSAMQIAITKFFGPNPNEVRKLLHSRS